MKQLMLYIQAYTRSLNLGGAFPICPGTARVWYRGGFRNYRVVQFDGPK